MTIPQTKPESVGINYLVGGSARAAFMHWLDAWSDIKDHMMFLFEASKGSVLELGVRGGISTSALLYGVEVLGGHVWSVDIDPKCAEAFKGHPQWTFVCDDSLAPGKAKQLLTMEYDLIFIDTDHIYERLSQELSLWARLVKKGGFVLMHDVLSFPAMAKAAEEYAAERNKIYTVIPGSNGLGVLHI